MQSNRPLPWSDTETGEFTEIVHYAMKAMRCESFTLPWKVGWWWASKTRSRCSGFCELLEELGRVCRGRSSGEILGSRDPKTEATTGGMPG